MAKNASYDNNKDYYQILGISNTATTGDALRAFDTKIKDLKARLNKKKITGEEYMAQYELLTEAADVLSNAEVRAQYDRDRKAIIPHTGDRQPVRVVQEEEAEETAKKGRGCLIPLAAVALAFIIFVSTLSGHLAYDALKKAGKLGDNTPTTGVEDVIDQDETKDEEKISGVQNFGDPTDEQQVAERVTAIQSQLNGLGVVNPQTGVPYTADELKGILQFINGAYLPSKEADAYTMVDEYLNFITSIINTPKVLNMVNYQGGSDAVTADIVQGNIQECAPFDFTTLLMGDSRCSTVISYFNDMYMKMLSTTDKNEYILLHNKYYQALADFMFGNGIVLEGVTYKIEDLEGLQNQNDAVVFGSLMYVVPVFHVEGINETFLVNNSLAGEVIVPISAIDEQFNALCSASELKIGDDGLLYAPAESNFATNTQVLQINSALLNHQLGNTDAYANGYQYTKKNN